MSHWECPYCGDTVPEGSGHCGESSGHMVEVCDHEWKWVKDWQGDPNVINGVQHFAYWQCKKCDSTDCEDEPPGPDPDYRREDRETL